MKNNSLALMALATSGLLFATTTASAGGGKAAEKSAEKSHKDTSKCSGASGCGGKGHKCVGGNSCKGKSACHTAENSCAGQNSCAGKGWINTKSEKECDEHKAKSKKS